MTREQTIGQHIKSLMDSSGWKQPQLAEEISVNQSLVSRWLSGDATPSVEALIKLGGLAAQRDPDEALFFWTQTRLDSRLLISISDALLRTGQPEANAILPVAEAILKERARDQGELEQEGKIVLVPPYTEDEWKSQASLPPQEVPAKYVSNLASTFFVVAGQEDHGWECAPGDRVVFDASAASTLRAAGFAGVPLLVNLRRFPRLERYPAPPTGLFIGKIELRRTGPTVHILLVRREREPEPIAFEPGRMINILSFTPEGSLSPSDLEASRSRGGRHFNVVPGAEPAVLSEIMFPGGFDIMGRFVALFVGDQEKISPEGTNATQKS